MPCWMICGAAILAPCHIATITPPSQAFAREVCAADRDGIVDPSVRYAGGECFAAFYPNVMKVPVQGRHIAYHWDGARIDRIRDLTDDKRIFEITG